MSFLRKIHSWRQRRLMFNHRKFLKRNKVILPRPDTRCQRNGPEAVV